MRLQLTWMVALFATLQFSFAQEKSISGTVTDESGIPLPGVAILVKESTKGTQTDFDGNYQISVQEGKILVFSYVGMKSAEKRVGANSVINIVLKVDAQVLDDVVVTAMGIRREKKSLGYATQEVSGDAVSEVKSSNFVNSLSGKVAGLDIKSSGTLGGSTNVVIRGNNSISGNNQALFVIDGTPISNDNNNGGDQETGRGGYDYGNAASDINPDDIESINILKGAAATALYGSRGMHGAVIITTKKGKKSKGIGVSVTSSVMWGVADKNTLPVYQKRYGAGYGPYYDDTSGYFLVNDFINSGQDDLLTPFTEDASYGAEFNPNLDVVQWFNIYPELIDSYKKKAPWVAAKNDPNYIWQTSLSTVNSVSLEGRTEKSNYRVGFTNMFQEGNLPNSRIDRNTLSVNASHNFTEKLKLSTTTTYTKTNGKGRYGTGYSSLNVMQQFRQWWQVNVDLEEQKEAYFATKKNITWNPNSINNLRPIYSDNPYWTFYENYETDVRNRYFGNTALSYEINDWLSILGKFSYDTYSELQEERINVGSADVSKYKRFNNSVAEYNYDLLLSFNKDLSEDFNIDGNIGYNLRKQSWSSITAQTNGGIAIPGLYALSNTVSPLQAPSEYSAKKEVSGAFARASAGYQGTFFLEGTFRRDRSSALPVNNNSYNYYSVSGSLILSNLLNFDWLNFTKVRANYAEVGDDTGPYRILKTYSVRTAFNGAGVASNPFSLNNKNLKPQRQKSYEIGMESKMFNNRVSFDIAYYNTITEQQIVEVPYSSATGYGSRWLNAGTMQNKGIEVMLSLVPIKTNSFQWDITFNLSKNKSLVVDLAEGIDNLQLASMQGGVSINATPGEPYGTIRGTDFVYKNGKKLIDSKGYYVKTDTNNEVIGNINPDWKGGVFNKFTYKQLSLGFLIDIQKGGSIFSLDTWYGYSTGLYDFTAGDNELGNPVRNSIAKGGGVLLEGVDENGGKNEVRAKASTYANPWGYVKAPNSAHVYDASFVKLRELSLSYTLSDKITEKTPFTSATVSLIGRNLWIIHKNIPYSDPEAGLSSGNIQGYQSGAYPAIKEMGLSFKLKF